MDAAHDRRGQERGGPGRTRRHRARLAGLAVVLATAVGVPVGLLAGGSSPPASTPAGGARAAATAALGPYVSGETTALEKRYPPRPGPFCPGGVSQHSGPVGAAGQLVALAAFCLPGDPRPVQVLAYASGHWSVRARLGPPDWPPSEAVAHGLPLTGEPVRTADLAGSDRPAFLVLLAAADNTPGFVVTDLSGRWGYAVFNGPYPPSTVLGRNPSFSGDRIVSEYDDCTPSCAAGHTTDVRWTFRPARGDFWAPDPPGWAPAPGAKNYRGGSTTTG